MPISAAKCTIESNQWGLHQLYNADSKKPYPFCSGYPLTQKPESLGDVTEWLAEWLWIGMRCQLVRSEGKTFIWSADGQLVSESFCELLEAPELLPEGTVLDGVIVGWAEGELLPFVNKELLEEAPVAFMAFDILEHAGQDVRCKLLTKRRQTLIQLLTPGALDTVPSCRGQLNPLLRVSPDLPFSSWDELAQTRTISRELKVAGVILKGTNSLYDADGGKNRWWKWKIG